MPVTPSAPDESRFQVHLGGLIEILSRHLYSSGPEVFVRELLQNACDALAARKALQQDFDPHIGISAFHRKSPDNDLCLRVVDNGIGLRPEDITQYLSTIGFSSKSCSPRGEASPFIGQFGVGLLSCFLVADEIMVCSRHVSAGTQPFRWTGRLDGSCSTTLLNELETGTCIQLRIDSRKTDFDIHKLHKAVRKFGEYLPWPLCFSGFNNLERINRAFPWEESEWNMPNVARLAKERMGLTPLGIFPFSSQFTETDGFAVIDSASAQPGADPGSVLYVKRMLVGDKIRGLVPFSLPFLHCFANSNSLRLNVSREALHGEETRLESLQADISTAFDKYLGELADRDPSLLREIVLTQLDAFLVACDSGEYGHILRDVVEVPTTLGRMTFNEILRRSHKVSYTRTEEDFQRIEVKAIQEGDIIVQGWFRHSAIIIQSAERDLPQGIVRGISASEYLRKFHVSISSESPREAQILVLAERELEGEDCSVCFDNREDPWELAALEMKDFESFVRVFGRQDNDGWQGETPETSKQLFLNRLHPVIEKMLLVPTLPEPDLIRNWIRVAYTTALLVAREVPSSGEMRRYGLALRGIHGRTIQEDE